MVAFGAVAGAVIAQKIEVGLLKKLFGYFLAILALYEIYTFVMEYIIKKNWNNKIR